MTKNITPNGRQEEGPKDKILHLRNRKKGKALPSAIRISNGMPVSKSELEKVIQNLLEFNPDISYEWVLTLMEYGYLISTKDFEMFIANMIETGQIIVNKKEE